MPPNITVSVTARALVMASDGDIISTATLCPDYAFDSFGNGGPRFSPDQHWVLVDVRGPFTPGNVPRTHVLVNVRTGAVIASPDFPLYLAVPASSGSLAWVSGERSVLRYDDGKTIALRDPLPRVVPSPRCSARVRS